MRRRSRAYVDGPPDTVVYLAAEVGGIGANPHNLGRFIYANMETGLHLIEEARSARPRGSSK